MKMETTLNDIFEVLDGKEIHAIAPYLPVKAFEPEHRGMLIELRSVLDSGGGGPECFLIALQCGHGDTSSLGHAIAADIAELTIPVAEHEHTPAAGYIISAIQAARWYADGKVDVDHMAHECGAARDLEDEFLDHYTDSCTWEALEAAASACFHQRPDKEECEGASCPIEVYKNTLRAIACNKDRYLQTARIFDACMNAVADNTGIDAASETILEPLITSIIEDIKPAINERVDFIIRTHLGW